MTPPPKSARGRSHTPPSSPAENGSASREQSGATLLAVGVIQRNNVVLSGPTQAQPMLFAHGFGCDQNMWRFVAPEFEGDFKVILFDHVGAGGSDLTAYDKSKYSTLQGYAADVVEIDGPFGADPIDSWLTIVSASLLAYLEPYRDNALEGHPWRDWASAARRPHVNRFRRRVPARPLLDRERRLKADGRQEVRHRPVLVDQ